mgnify:CR=1 FL=1
MDVTGRLSELRETARLEIERTAERDALERIRVRYLGRKGALRALLGHIASLPDEEKRRAGQLGNQIRRELEAMLEERLKAVEATAKQSAAPAIDFSLPGIRRPLGRIHPISRAYDELCEIFMQLGFEIVYGPEVEQEFYNFDALNFPPDHPARDSFDTLYLDGDRLMRCHTSPVQIRAMQERKPPLRVIAPGRVYRRDTADASHFPTFHQMEGLAVGEDVTFADLKAILTMAMKRLFGEKVRTRFRPSFFPFTEPSAEVDVSCRFCNGQGCGACGGKGWTELLGAGMVHPNVFRAVGYDPEKYTGFAFGMGIDRIAMTKYGIHDIRLLFENDLRFLHQL